MANFITYSMTIPMGADTFTVKPNIYINQELATGLRNGTIPLNGSGLSLSQLLETLKDTTGVITNKYYIRSWGASDTSNPGVFEDVFNNSITFPAVPSGYLDTGLKENRYNAFYFRCDRYSGITGCNNDGGSFVDRTTPFYAYATPSTTVRTLLIAYTDTYSPDLMLTNTGTITITYNINNNTWGYDALAPTNISNNVTTEVLNFFGSSPTPDPSQGIDSDGNPIGGDGNYDFVGDDIDMPGAPDETISGALASGFLNVYKPSAANLQSFGAALWTNAFNVKWFDIDSVTNLVLNAVSDPIDYIIGLFMLPVSPTVGGSDGINLGGIKVNNISVPKVSKQYVTLDFGTIEIAELYGNYLDYSNSRVSIYLPYVGTADIDVQEINGGSIQLQYIVDCFTGACVANVRCVKSTAAPWGTSYENSTIHSYSGNMAIQLPISAGSFDTLTQGLINVGLGLGTNTPAIAMTGAKDVMQGFAGDVTTRGSLSSNTGKLGYQTPYLMFTRPIESRPANLGALHGYSAGVGGVLSAFSGYVVCSDVKLDGVTATDSELNEIDSILKSGVYV